MKTATAVWTSVVGTYPGGTTAAWADCDAEGWEHWEAEVGSEIETLHSGLLWLYAEVCHRCQCWDLQWERKT